VIDAQLAAATSDIVIGLAVAVPVVVVAGGVALGMRLRGRGTKGHVPSGEVASDAPTDLELARSADVTRIAEEERGEAPLLEAGAAPPTEAEPAPPAEPASYRSRLGKARGLLSGYLGAVRSKGRIDAATWDDLEEALIRADVGMGAADALVGDLRARVKSGAIAGPDALVDALKGDLVAMLSTADAELAPPGWSQQAAWVLPVTDKTVPATDPATGVTVAVTEAPSPNAFWACTRK